MGDLVKVVKQNDFLEVDFTARDDEGKVFDTTSADVARTNGIFNEKTPYKPVIIVAGVGQVISGLDEALLAAGEGELKKIELSPAQAFGERNSELVKLISLGKFRNQEINPQPGMVMDFDGMPGRIVSVDSGRVKIDFNSPLAGKNVVYEFKVNKVYSTAQDKVSGLTQSFFNSKGVSSSLEAEKAVVTVNAQVMKDSDFIGLKLRLIQMLLQYAGDGVKTVEFIEDYALNKE